ncbi:MAG: TadE/TadG family type IV pilus assembly protein [Pseudomonadota bacterium]
MRFLIKRYLRATRGAATIEYILLLLPLLALVLTAFQIALAYHFTLTAQQAVELGARIAAVRDPVSTAMPDVNEVAAGFSQGQSCSIGACEPPGGPWVCSGENLGGECDAVAYNAIFLEVARIAYLLDPDDLSVSYIDGRLGFAGGPFTPIVQVEIREKPFFLQFLFNLALADGSAEVEEVTLPAVAASAIAEDLSSTN